MAVISKARPPQAVVKELRHCLASVISGFKAYDVEKVCERIGLRTVNGQDPFNSKYKYAMSCILAESIESIANAARQLLVDDDNFELSEAVNKHDELYIEKITEITRRRIFSVFDNRMLCTEIEVIDLLRRIWPVDSMPSCYKPNTERSLADDIWQHSVNNDDWSNRQLLETVGAVDCSQGLFFQFIAIVTDPLVQKPEVQAELVDQINSHLLHDGYKLAKVKITSGCPTYAVQSAPKGAPGDRNISEVLEAFDPDQVHARWMAIVESRGSNPSRTITLSRTLLEDVCKYIIVEAGDTYVEDADLPILYKQLSKILKVAPDDHTEQIFKQILSGCHSVVQGLGSLRNKLSDAHSIGPIRARPLPRHAELAANLSGAMATFLISTWRARQEEAARAKAGPQPAAVS